MDKKNLIDKIEIKYYKGIYDESIKGVSALNVISGKNDAGKSTIIEALDLFFSERDVDFSNAYNKNRRRDIHDKIKGKQQILISITFNSPPSSKVLPKKVKVTKVWGRNGELINVYDNLEDALRRSAKEDQSPSRAKSSLTQFLNRIKYIHIPSIRDDVFFTQLISLLQEELFSDTSKNVSINKIQLKAQQLNDLISKTTKNISDNFEEISGINTRLIVPTDINDLFQKMLIDTKYESFDIPISGRGDGIKMHYIPSLLNYISTNSKNHFVWGFDEPENSCEYHLQKMLSDEFSQVYSTESQIFLCTHSFAFTNLEGKDISQYRIYKDHENLKSHIELLTPNTKNDLHEELGLLTLNSEIAKLFQTHQEDVDTLNRLKEENDRRNKPVLLFEGATDISLFETAYLNLKKADLRDDFIVNEFMQDPKYGSHVGSGAPSLNEFMYNHVGKGFLGNKIIAIFDNDFEGLNQLNGLMKSRLYERYNELPYNNVYKHISETGIYALALQAPPFREEFVDIKLNRFCFVSTELLLEDADIPISNRAFPSKLDHSVFGFHGQKQKFAAKIAEKYASSEHEEVFEGFRSTFKLIDMLTKS